MRYKKTEWGFKVGAANIRWASFNKKMGWVGLTLKTPKHPEGICIYVTKKGKVRLVCSDDNRRLPLGCIRGQLHWIYPPV